MYYSCPSFNAAADCGEPEAPPNGNVAFTSTTVGSVAVYSCDEAFDLNPLIPVTQTCAFDGTEAKWSGLEPKCMGKEVIRHCYT